MTGKLTYTSTVTLTDATNVAATEMTSIVPPINKYINRHLLENMPCKENLIK